MASVLLSGNNDDSDFNDWFIQQQEAEIDLILRNYDDDEENDEANEEEEDTSLTEAETPSAANELPEVGKWVGIVNCGVLNVHLRRELCALLCLLTGGKKSIKLELRRLRSALGYHFERCTQL